MDVSENSGTPKSSSLIGFSIINHPFWGTPIFGNTHINYTINNNQESYQLVVQPRGQGFLEKKSSDPSSWGKNSALLFPIIYTGPVFPNMEGNIAGWKISFV